MFFHVVEEKHPSQSMELSTLMVHNKIRNDMNPFSLMGLRIPDRVEKTDTLLLTQK